MNRKLLTILSMLLLSMTCFAANSEKDFNYKIADDGDSIVITGFKNNLTLYDIPTEIEEIPVSSVVLQESLGYVESGFTDTTEITIKLPDGLKEFTLLQRQGGVKGHITIEQLPSSLEKCDIRTQRDEKNPNHFYISLKGSINQLNKLTEFNAEYIDFEEKTVTVRKEWQYKISDYAEPKYSFQGSNIEEAIFEDGLEIVDGFRDCKNLNKITLPSTVQKIASYTFTFSSSLSEIVIPDGLTAIKAFYGNQIFDGTAIPLKTQVKLRKLGYKGKFGNE